MNITKHKTFGDTLRERRKARRIQLGTLATMLDVAPSYLSDVELGRRPPFRAELIRRCATLLALDDRGLDELLEAATVERDTFELPVEHHIPESIELSATLMREWPHLSPDHKRAVTNFVRGLTRSRGPQA